MKKTKISTSIPAFIDSLIQPTSNTKHTTMAKLKVFYKGTTNDGRYFSEEFSNKLLETLPETPVVALYDEEEKDFLGHAEQQGIFGYVPENAKITFEEIDGREWAVTDVKLFTEREDVGRIARKIIGKEHSLELAPNTLKYTLASEEELERGEPWVTFIEGDLIGLSVLGEWQSPAFQGSEFFEDGYSFSIPLSLEETIAKYIKMPKEIEIQIGGETMFLEFVTGLHNNLKIESVLENDLFLIYKVGDKVYLALKEGEEMVNVDISEAFIPSMESEEETQEEEVNAEETEEEAAPEEVVPIVESEEADPEPEAPEMTNDNTEEPEEQEQESEQGVEPEAPQTPADASSLSDAERQELEAYRRKDKEGLIESFADFLSKELIDKYTKELDNYSVFELEQKLSIEAMRKIKAEKQTEINTETFARGFIGQSETNTSTSELEVSVRKYLKDTRGDK